MLECQWSESVRKFDGRCWEFNRPTAKRFEIWRKGLLRRLHVLKCIIVELRCLSGVLCTDLGVRYVNITRKTKSMYITVILHK